MNVLYFAGLPIGQIMREEFPAFTKATGITVNFQEVPYDGVRQRQLSSIQSKAGSYDVIFVDDIWMYEYVRRGYIRPLDSFVQRDAIDMDDFVESVRRAEAELDGQIWLMPQRADVQVLFYRRDLFEDSATRELFRRTYKRELAVPSTWNEYREVARFFATAPVAKNISPIAETLKRPHFSFEFFAMRYWAFSGENFFDDGGRPVFDSAAGVDALDFLGTLREHAAPGSANAAHDETISTFAQGGAVMAPQWYAFYPTLRDPASSKVGNVLGVAMVPGFAVSDGSLRRTPSIGGGSLGIPSDARSPEEAWQFIKYMTSADFMARAAVRGAIVPRQSAYRNPEVARRNPAVSVYLDSLRVAWFRPRLEQFAEIEAIIGRAVSQAFVGELPAAKALAQAKADVNATISK